MKRFALPLGVALAVWCAFAVSLQLVKLAQ
jgi:hypothetical protein